MTHLSSTSIDSALWSIELYLMRRYGCDAAAREIAPLRWYIGTGRASVSFLHGLLEAKTFMVARKLHEGGSDETVIRRVADYLG